MKCWEDTITIFTWLEKLQLFFFSYYYYWWWRIIKWGHAGSVVCCKAALPSGHFAIIMLSLCLKSAEHPQGLSEYRFIYISYLYIYRKLGRVYVHLGILSQMINQFQGGGIKDPMLSLKIAKISLGSHSPNLLLFVKVSSERRKEKYLSIWVHSWER